MDTEFSGILCVLWTCRVTVLVTSTGLGTTWHSYWRTPHIWMVTMAMSRVCDRSCPVFTDGACHLFLIVPAQFDTSDKLFTETNSRVEFERSYTCVSSQLVNFNTIDGIYPHWNVSQLHVQAFHFRNSTSGKFDNGKCI